MTPNVHTRARRPGAQESDIRLTLPARPENIAVVRHMLGALGQAIELSPAVGDDVRLAVTEACTNVVRHAYPDRSGTFDVVVRPEEERLEVVVADSGRGMGPSPDRLGPGLGLPLIAALADSFDIDETVSSGSRLVMSFTRTRRGPAMRPL